MKPKKKLLLNDKVEVRQLEEGLRGSWHPGVVVGVSEFYRSVKYDELLSENGDSNLVESIRITRGIRGIQELDSVSSKYRGRIRPCPSASDVCTGLEVGVCVDAFFEDAWWEGVIFDCNDDADERLVYFLDERDQQFFNVKDLRITREWDETLDVWQDRGVWVSREMFQKRNFPLVIGSKRKHALKQSQNIDLNPKSPSKVNEKVAMASENCVKNIGFQVAMSPLRKSKRKRGSSNFRLSDTICTFCRDCRDLIPCDNCSSSYHLNCLNIEGSKSEIWFCPLCSCCLCGSNCCKEQSTGTCLQCCREYHLSCVNEAGPGPSMDYPSDNFCGMACYELCLQLHKLLGRSNHTSDSGFTWSLVRSSKNIFNFPGVSRAENLIKLSHILKVLHKCFEPVKDSHTKRDIVRDIVYNSQSKLKRMDFIGFYTMVLQRGDEIVSVATVRFHGPKAAEMPLVATPFEYRGQGMCRLLMNELLKLLTRLGIERLILSAIPELVKTWTDSFGFHEMSRSERLKFMGYPLLAFQGSTMLQRFLSPSQETSGKSDVEATSQNLEDLSSSSSLDTKCERRSRRRPHGLSSEADKIETRYIGKENIGNLCNKRMKTTSYVYKQCIMT